MHTIRHEIGQRTSVGVLGGRDPGNVQNTGSTFGDAVRRIAPNAKRITRRAPRPRPTEDEITEFKSQGQIKSGSTDRSTRTLVFSHGAPRTRHRQSRGSPSHLSTVVPSRKRTLPTERVIFTSPPAPVLLLSPVRPRSTPASSPDDD